MTLDEALDAALYALQRADTPHCRIAEAVIVEHRRQLREMYAACEALRHATTRGNECACGAGNRLRGRHHSVVCGLYGASTADSD